MIVTNIVGTFDCVKGRRNDKKGTSEQLMAAVYKNYKRDIKCR